ncbi:MAG: hypothetical protein AAFY65_13405 [Pseudomonadota bacterium]
MDLSLTPPKRDGIVWTGSTLLDVTAPEPSAIRPADIALALARAPRFGGRTRRDLPSYSVAWHSMFCEKVADMMGLPIWVRLQCLLHDAPEYLMGDMASPIKSVLPDYRGLEGILWEAVARRFQIPVEKHPAVAEIDAIAFGHEARHLLAEDAWAPIPMPIADPAWAEMADKWMLFALRKRPNDGKMFGPDGREVFASALFQSRLEALSDLRAAEDQAHG